MAARRPLTLGATLQQPKRPDEKERERKKFYDSSAWRKCRQIFLAENPICVDCLAKGVVTEATIPHHQLERLEHPDLAFDHENLVALCSSCHTLRHKVRQPH